MAGLGDHLVADGVVQVEADPAPPAAEVGREAPADSRATQPVTEAVGSLPKCGDVELWGTPSKRYECTRQNTDAFPEQREKYIEQSETRSFSGF